MAKKRLQRVFVVGSEYELFGSRGRKRRLKFVGRAKLNRREHLIFRPVRKAAKHRRRGLTNGIASEGHSTNRSCLASGVTGFGAEALHRIAELIKLSAEAEGKLRIPRPSRRT